MYQRPDFVKVDLDIKDNYAAYTSCTADIGGYFNQNDSEGPHPCSFPNDGTTYNLAVVNPSICYTTHDMP